MVAWGLALALLAPPAVAAAAPAAPARDPGAIADAYVAANRATLLVGNGQRLTRTGVIDGAAGLHFVTYARWLRALIVDGGDVVVMTDAARVLAFANALHNPLPALPPNTTVASATATQAAAISAQRAGIDVTAAGTPELVVWAHGGVPVRAWRVTVTGHKDVTPVELTVVVDAATAHLITTFDSVRTGSGVGFYSGPVSFGTTPEAGGFAMRDPARPGLQCGVLPVPTVPSVPPPLVQPTDQWGSGSATDLVTACVDVMYAAAQEWNMLRVWFGRLGFDGRGHAVPAAVGLADVNAYYVPDLPVIVFGHTLDRARNVTAMDIVAHEYAHVVFDTTPGSTGSTVENGGLNEGSSDIFSQLTIAFANNPRIPLNFRIGQQVNLFGTGAIRVMYQPSLAGDPDCFFPGIGATEEHSAAGPFNHWFYLLAEGSRPAGRPASPTCNGTTLRGLGIRTAGSVFYHSLLLKTSTWTYVDARRASLLVALHLFPASCAVFDAVKAAWDAVSVPATRGEPTCGELPATGSSGSLDVATAGAGLVALGVLVLLGARRRRRAP